MADLHAPQHVATTIMALANKLERRGTADFISAQPTPQERGRLRERELSIRSLLAPTSNSVGAQQLVGAALGEMLGGYLEVKLVGMDPAKKRAAVQEAIGGYAHLLQDLPGWAIVQVCTEFKEGRAYEVVDGREKRLSPDFAPAAPRIHMLVRAKLDALYAEAETIKRIQTAKLAAPSIAPEEHERVKVLMRETADQMLGKANAERKAEMANTSRMAQEARDRAAQILQAGNGRRLARYAELELVPVYSPDGKVVVDPDKLHERDRHHVVRGGDYAG
jgi:hypothetical protein